MPQITIDIDDKGEIVGAPPAQIEALFKRTETTGYGNGLKKGREDAGVESKAELEARLASERTKWEESHPLDKAKLRELEDDNKRFRESEASLVKRYTDNQREREESHAKEVANKNERVGALTRKLNDMLASQIRTEAASAGARDESLDELAVILRHYIELDDNLETIVKDTDGKPTMKQGKPISSAEFIRDYLGKHAHHRKPAGGPGGGARGGASYQGNTSAVSETAAVDRVTGGDRSPDAINSLFEATRRRAS